MDLNSKKDRILPQDESLEKYILGCMLMERGCILKAVPVLKELDFYNTSNAIIFKIIYDLFSSGSETDSISVARELKKRESLEIIGGLLYIRELTDLVNSTTTIESNIWALKEITLKREIIKITSDVNEQCYQDGVDGAEAFDLLQNKVNALSRGFDDGRSKHLSTLLDEAFDHIKSSMGKEGMTGVKTGFFSIDSITGGFQPQDLIILAARPGMGKTSLVVSMARNSAVMFKQPIAIFSLEMSARQLVNRIIAGEMGEFSANQLNRGAISDAEFESIVSKAGKLKNYPIFIDDTAGLSLTNFRSKAYRLVAEYSIMCIVVDYLQLMRAESRGSREQEISEISRGLKMIAKELNIPIIALSQLSRAVESRNDKRPMLSDLRESGAIEQDADVVTFIYRPEYYGITENDSGGSTAGLAEVIFAKHRSGSLETAYLRFAAKQAKFMDLDQSEGPFAPF